MYNIFQLPPAKIQAIANKLAEFITTKGVSTIISGGDSVAAVEKAGTTDKIKVIAAPSFAGIVHLRSNLTGQSHLCCTVLTCNSIGRALDLDIPPVCSARPN